MTPRLPAHPHSPLAPTGSLTLISQQLLHPSCRLHPTLRSLESLRRDSGPLQRGEEKEETPERETANTVPRQMLALCASTTSAQQSP